MTQGSPATGPTRRTLAKGAGWALPAISFAPPAPAVSRDAAGRCGMSAGVRIRNLHNAYGGRTVLHGIDLDLPAGTVTAIIGPSGSGKSTGPPGPVRRSVPPPER